MYITMHAIQCNFKDPTFPSVFYCKNYQAKAQHTDIMLIKAMQLKNQ